MNVYHSPGDHFIILDRVFGKKKDKMQQREEKNLTPEE